MNTKHLEYILEVYRCGSVNKAAKTCYLSQSHLSKIIKDIEAEIGFSLFERSSNKLTFNRNGLYFIESAEAIVAESHKIQRIPQMVSDNSCMHIVSSPSAALAQSFMAFRKPNVATDHGDSDIYKEAGLHDIIQQVFSRETPMGIMSIFEKMVSKYAAICERHGLRMDLIKGGLPVYLMMSIRHPLARLDKIFTHDLADYPFVLDSHIDSDDTLVGLLKLKQPKNSLIVDNRASRMDAVMSGSYLCHSTPLPPEELRSKNLCIRPIEDFNEYMAVYSLKHAGQSFSVRETEFISFIKSQL